METEAERAQVMAVPEADPERDSFASAAVSPPSSPPPPPTPTPTTAGGLQPHQNLDFKFQSPGSLDGESQAPRRLVPMKFHIPIGVKKRDATVGPQRTPDSNTSCSLTLSPPEAPRPRKHAWIDDDRAIPLSLTKPSPGALRVRKRDHTGRFVSRP